VPLEGEGETARVAHDNIRGGAYFATGDEEEAANDIDAA
jgi:hypothetical protein